MKQEHYGALALLLLFGAAIFVEFLPFISAACLAGIMGCLVKGELWEFKEGSDNFDNSSD